MSSRVSTTARGDSRWLTRPSLSPCTLRRGLRLASVDLALANAGGSSARGPLPTDAVVSKQLPVTRLAEALLQVQAGGVCSDVCASKLLSKPTASRKHSLNKRR